MILVMIVCACQITQAQSLPDMEAIMRFSGSDDPMELNPGISSLSSSETEQRFRV